jgi:indole-3-glycerol phosphate synthase
VSADAADAVVPNVLARILESTRAELEKRKRELPLEQLAARAQRAHRAGERSSRRFREALARPGIAVIAEFKRRSPSAGELRERAEVSEIARAYERGGASALSVLTDAPHFGGSLEDLRAARGATELPILRKDFIVDEYQLYEALCAGADAVLLIVAALRPAELASLHERALALGLDALVEVHDAGELSVALACGAQLIGINNRDLRDFSVDVRRTSRLVAGVPEDVTLVSESGIASAEQLTALASEGVNAVLIGERLMRAPDPEAELRSLLGAGAARAASSGRTFSSLRRPL